MANPMKNAVQATRRNRPLRFLARLGFAVNGLLHALIGAIAISLAIGPGGEADQSGALAALARTPGGVFLLWTVFVGLVALGLWLVIGAFLMGPGKGKRVVHYLEVIGKGLAYLALAATAFTFARGGSTSSAGSATSFSASILAMPGGPLIIAAIGAIIFAVGIYFFVKGVSKRFTRDLTLPPGSAGRATVALGVFGYVAKGVVLCVVGILFCVAAATLDPSKGSGLDGGLRSLAALPFGVFILVVAGLGLIAYGIYSFVRARFARL